MSLQFVDFGLGKSYDCHLHDFAYGGHVAEFGFAATARTVGANCFTVEFVNSDGRIWHGTFERGLGKLSSVYSTFDRDTCCVVASGQGYLVNVNSPNLYTLIKEIPVTAVHIVKSIPSVIVVTLTDIAGYGLAGRLWRTQRLSWDGFDNIRIADREMLGTAWDGLKQSTVEFRVDLQTGVSSGGASPI